MADMVTLREGMDVYGADGDKLGSIDGVFADYVSVKKGFFFPEDHYVPISAIQGVDEDDKVWLTVTKDEALNQRWDRLPEAGFNATDTSYLATENETAATGSAYAAGDYVGTERAAAMRLLRSPATWLLAGYPSSTSKATSLPSTLRFFSCRVET